MATSEARWRPEDGAVGRRYTPRLRGMHSRGRHASHSHKATGLQEASGGHRAGLVRVSGRRMLTMTRCRTCCGVDGERRLGEVERREGDGWSGGAAQEPRARGPERRVGAGKMG